MSWKTIGVIVGVIGILILCVGVFLILVQDSLKASMQNDEQATGVVVSNEIANAAYCPKFTFTTKEGQPITFQLGSSPTNACTRISEYQVGEQVTVYYDPQDPANTATLAKGNNSFESFLAEMAWIVICLAIPCILLGLALFVLGLVNSRREATANIP
jgi:uncharacterized membrane protein